MPIQRGWCVSRKEKKKKKKVGVHGVIGLVDLNYEDSKKDARRKNST